MIMAITVIKVPTKLTQQHVSHLFNMYIPAVNNLSESKVLGWHWVLAYLLVEALLEYVLMFKLSHTRDYY